MAVRTIHENLALTQLAENAQVVRADVFEYLSRPPSRPFDVVYIAPPQYQGLWKKALAQLDEQPGWLNPDGVVVVQIDPKEQEAIPLDALEAYDERTYGSTLLWFFEKPGE
jgi:16S rRNA G966 N2-methylase RsmD